MFNWILIIAIAFVLVPAAIKLALDLKKERKDSGKWNYFLVAFYVIGTAGAIWGLLGQRQASNDLMKKYDTQQDSLLKEIKYLKGMESDGNKTFIGQFDTLRADNDTILSKIETIKKTPNPKSVIINKSMELEEVENKRIVQTDAKTGLINSRFIFRSKYMTPLRDIRIEMTFDKPVISVNSYIYGAWVKEQGTSKSPISSTRYIYQTGNLDESNVIIFDVVSREPIKPKIILSP
jgi:hypothetical protein